MLSGVVKLDTQADEAVGNRAFEQAVEEPGLGPQAARAEKLPHPLSATEYV